MAYQTTMQTSYPTCDTFFVEEDEPRQNHRELLRLEKRKRQEDMASELSRLTSDEYLTDIISHMRAMEVRDIAMYRHSTMILM